MTVLKKIKHMKSSHILAVSFLLFIFYVGLAAFPQFLSNTRDAFSDGFSLRAYIRSIDDQYKGMLTAVQETPLLQNKGTYINLNGLMANVLDQPFMNERVKLTNGHLADTAAEEIPADTVKQVADNLIRFSRKQTEREKTFLFVLAPSQIDPENDLLPAGYTDTANKTADTLLRFLEDGGVSCLDLREAMEEDGLNRTEAFFVTDHHWTPQTGFWAYEKILEALAEQGAISPVDTFYINKANYDFQIHEDSFLGAAGRRTGIYYAGLDDFCVIAPKFDTDILVRMESSGLDLQGRYEDVCNFNMSDSYFSNPDFFNTSAYDIYGRSDTALVQRRNTGAPEDSRFLLIGDSFGNVPFSLMSLYISSCDELDMRYFSDSFEDYYRANLPDTVVLLVNAHNCTDLNASYPFFPEAEP